MTLEEYLNKDEDQEQLDEMKSLGVGKIAEKLKDNKIMDKRSTKFYLGDKPMKHAGTDVDLNAFKSQLQKVNELIKEYNKKIDMVKRDAVPDSEANMKFVKETNKLKKQIDKVDEDLKKRRDSIKKKMDEYDKQGKDRMKKGEKMVRKGKQKDTKRQIGMAMGKMPAYEATEFKDKVKRLLGE